MLIASDLHLYSFPDFSRPWEDGCTTRLKVGMDYGLDRVFQIAEDLGESEIVITGDIYHVAPALGTPMHDKVSRRLYGLLKKHTITKLVLLPGNHDMPNQNNPAGTTLSSFSGHPLIEVIEGVTRHSELDVLFIPYYQNYDFVREQLNQVRTGNYGAPRCIMAHWDIREANSSLENYILPKKALLSSELLGLPFIVTGHYHCPQEIHSGGKLVGLYVGSTLPQTRADLDQTKRVLQFKNDGTFQSIPLRGPEIREVEITEKPFPDLDPKHWWRILCPKELIRDIRKHYTDHLVKPIALKTAEEVKTRLQVSSAAPPLVQYIRHKNPNLDHAVLEQIGRYYTDQCC